MKYKLAVVALIALALSYVGIVSAHQGNDNGIYPYHSMQYQEMLDLHKQYFNDEITSREFFEKMENSDYHDEVNSCHGGYGMMGYPMMGMMWG